MQTTPPEQVVLEVGDHFKGEYTRILNRSREEQQKLKEELAAEGLLDSL